MRGFITFLSIFTGFFFLIPALFIQKAQDPTPIPTDPPRQQAQFLPQTLRKEGKTVATADLLTEMMAAMDLCGYQEESLKAAAVAAATLLAETYERQGNADGLSTCSAAEAKAAWGNYWFETYWTELQQAVTDTWGQRLTVNGATALGIRTFPLSWGKTAEGIACPYDFTSNDFETQITVSLTQFKTVFSDYKNTLSVKKSQSGRVETVTSGSTVLTGEETAERFELPSLSFSIAIKDVAVFTCYGQGNGEGMSLYAANELAKRGSTYEEILAYFYPHAVLSGPDQEAYREAGST